MWGFADPTGRTDRIFRHDDHKFEWTVDECVKWCKAAAHEWGYDVIIDGIGRSINKDPWGRDNDAVHASQVVTFRRREGDEWVTKRTEKYAEWASKREEQSQSHKLLVTHQYEAHVGAQSPASREEIAAAVKTTIQDIASPEVTIFEIWREDAVSTICGGWLELLLDVLDQDDSFLVHKEGKNADDWKIELPGVELLGRNPWQSPAKQDDDAWGESSESAESGETLDDEEEYDEYYEEEEEYDGDNWDETEDAGWTVSETEGWGKEESDINTLKAWEEWRPQPGWIVEGSWE